jgi:hypothetical protein
VLAARGRMRRLTSALECWRAAGHGVRG